MSYSGHFKGYKIETWTEKEGEIRAREMISNASKAFVNKFVPHTVNLVRVRVINSAYRGPASDVLSFKTPEGSMDIQLFFFHFALLSFYNYVTIVLIIFFFFRTWTSGLF